MCRTELSLKVEYVKKKLEHVLLKLIALLRIFSQRLIQCIKREREESLLYVIVVIYTAIFSYFTVMKMYALRSSAWDLGNYNQGLYTFVFCGKLFYWTADILNNPSGSLFGIHVSPVFFLLAPIYALFPKSETLLVIQSFAIAVGAIPFYRLAYYHLNSKRMCLILAISYFVNPVIIGINWSEFHPEAFIPAIILFFLYFYQRGEWKKLIISLILALSIMGEVAIVTTFSAIYFLFLTFRQIQKKHEKPYSIKLYSSILIFSISFCWLLLSIAIKSYFNPIFPLYFGTTGSWRILGAKNILEIPRIIITNPYKVIEALSYDWVSKILYLIILFGSSGFLSIFSPFELFPSVAWLLPSLLSDNPAYYTIGLQYPAFVIPFVLYSSVKGMRRLVYSIRKLNEVHFSNSSRLPSFVLIFSLILFSLSNPFFGPNVAVHEWGRYGYPLITPNAESAKKLVELLPENASVLASHNIFPLLSSRLEAYTIPWVIDYGTASYFTYIYKLVNKVDFVLLDLTGGLDPARNALILSFTKDFGVLAYSDGILLLKRGYRGSPIVYKLYREIFDYKNLILKNGFLVYDNSSRSEKVLAGVNVDNASQADFWWGPYVMMFPGVYNIKFWLKSISPTPSDGELLTLDVSAFILKIKAFIVKIKETGAKYVNVDCETTGQKIEFPGLTLKGYMFNSTDYQPFSINLTLNIFGIYEFRGMKLRSKIPLFLDRVEVEQVKPLAYYEPISLQFEDYPVYFMDLEHVSLVVECSNLLSELEPLMIQDDLLTLVNYKGPVYPIPSCIEAQSNETFLNQLDYRLSQVKYVMLDWKSNPALSYFILSRPIVINEFGTKAWADGVILLERGYSHDLVLFEPFNQTIPLETLTLLEGTSLLKDNLTGNYILVHANITNLDFWWGPYIMLPPGDYQAVYKLKVIKNITTDVFTLKVYLFPAEVNIEIKRNNQGRYMPYISLDQTGNKIEIESKDITGRDFYEVGRFVEFVINFTANAPGKYEFPGRFVKTDVNIYLCQIQISMIKPLP